MRFEFIIKHKRKNYRFVIHFLNRRGWVMNFINKRRAKKEAKAIVKEFPSWKGDSYFKNLKELLEFRK